MVDSVKQYNLAGVAAEVELGKRGSKIDGASSGEQVSLKKNDSSLAHAEVADGTEAQHAVTKAQLDAATDSKFEVAEFTVNYNSGTLELGTFSAGTTVFSTMVEKGDGNWSGASNITEITVGTTGNNSLLFSGFDVTAQVVDEINHKFVTDTAVNAYVGAGGATTGTAKIVITYSGTIS